MSAHLIALLMKWRTGIPWIADFRDPWRDNGFRRRGSRLVEAWDEFLETCALKHADRIVCNTPAARTQLQRRHPWIAAKCSTILNGIDFDLLAPIKPNRGEPQDRFVLAHCGQFYGPRSPRPWFRALNHLRLRDPALGRGIRFVSVGCEAYDGEPLPRIAQQEGVADLVRVLPHQAHRASLEIAAGADAVIVAGSAGAGAHLQVPNKLFEYLGLHKSMIVALDDRNPALPILKAAKARASFCSPGDPPSIAHAIEQTVSGPADNRADWSGVSQFDRTYRAAELLDLFETLVEPIAAPRVQPAVSFPAAQLAAVPILRPGSGLNPARSECSTPL